MTCLRIVAGGNDGRKSASFRQEERPAGAFAACSRRREILMQRAHRARAVGIWRITPLGRLMPLVHYSSTVRYHRSALSAPGSCGTRCSLAELCDGLHELRIVANDVQFMSSCFGESCPSLSTTDRGDAHVQPTWNRTSPVTLRARVWSEGATSVMAFDSLTGVATNINATASSVFTRRDGDALMRAKTRSLGSRQFTNSAIIVVNSMPCHYSHAVARKTA